MLASIVPVHDEPLCGTSHRAMLLSLNKQCRVWLTLFMGVFISMDEMTIAYFGRHRLRMYNSSKPNKYTERTRPRHCPLPSPPPHHHCPCRHPRPVYGACSPMVRRPGTTSRSTRPWRPT